MWDRRILNTVFREKSSMILFLPRDAALAQYVLEPSVRVSVSVTNRRSTEIAEHTIMQTTPHDGLDSLVFDIK